MNAIKKRLLGIHLNLFPKETQRKLKENTFRKRGIYQQKNYL